MSIAAQLFARSHVLGSKDAEAVARRRRERAAARLAPLTLSRQGTPLLQARDACTFVSRLRGLHAVPPLGPDEALLIRPCNRVQTWRMAYPIDALFLAADGTLLEVRTLEPGRSAGCRRAHMVIEALAGTAARLELEPGHLLRIEGGE